MSSPYGSRRPSTYRGAKASCELVGEFETERATKQRDVVSMLVTRCIAAMPTQRPFRRFASHGSAIDPGRRPFSDMHIDDAANVV